MSMPGMRQGGGYRRRIPLEGSSSRGRGSDISIGLDGRLR